MATELEIELVLSLLRDRVKGKKKPTIFSMSEVSIAGFVSENVPNPRDFSASKKVISSDFREIMLAIEKRTQGEFSIVNTFEKKGFEITSPVKNKHSGKLPIYEIKYQPVDYIQDQNKTILITVDFNENTVSRGDIAIEPFRTTSKHLKTALLVLGKKQVYKQPEEILTDVGNPKEAMREIVRRVAPKAQAALKLKDALIEMNEGRGYRLGKNYAVNVIEVKK